VHIHHDGETGQAFCRRVREFAETLHNRHRLLRRREGRIVFGFIHGNFALDNSRPDGRWCGLNNEVTLLRDLGCYADFTYPSAPSETQARMINRIYWATDDPARPRSADTGQVLEAGRPATGDLLMVPGPLALRRREGSINPIPVLETGELAGYAPPSSNRVRVWIRHAPRIGSDIFLKLFTHGAQERNSELLLDGGLDRVFDLVAAECRRQGRRFHFVSAWEMFQAIETAWRSSL
jgi:hypothetical protein